MRPPLYRLAMLILGTLLSVAFAANPPRPEHLRPSRVSFEELETFQGVP